MLRWVGKRQTQSKVRDGAMDLKGAIDPKLISFSAILVDVKSGWQKPRSNASSDKRKRLKMNIGNQGLSVNRHAYKDSSEMFRL